METFDTTMLEDKAMDWSMWEKRSPTWTNQKEED
jgi:hypothetical protein